MSAWNLSPRVIIWAPSGSTLGHPYNYTCRQIPCTDVTMLQLLLLHSDLCIIYLVHSDLCSHFSSLHETTTHRKWQPLQAPPLLLSPKGGWSRQAPPLLLSPKGGWSRAWHHGCVCVCVCVCACGCVCVWCICVFTSCTSHHPHTLTVTPFTPPQFSTWLNVYIHWWSWLTHLLSLMW